MARTNTSNRLADMNLAELVDELRATKHEALNLRFRNATGQLDNTAEITRVRRQIARINTPSVSARSLPPRQRAE